MNVTVLKDSHPSELLCCVYHINQHAETIFKQSDNQQSPLMGNSLFLLLNVFRFVARYLG